MSIDPPGHNILRAQVNIDIDSSGVLSLKPKAIDHIRIPIAIDVLCPHQLLQLLYSDRASQEEGVDLRVQRSSRTPSFNGQLVVAGLAGETAGAVAFNAMTVPGIHGVYLEKKAWSRFKTLVFSEELIVKREAEMACKLGGVILTYDIAIIYSSLRSVGYTLPLIKF